MTPTALLVLALVYVAGLFAIANYFEHRDGSRRQGSPYVYALTLAVYCSSWSFYGAVGSMASLPWSHASIYLGPFIVLTLGRPIVDRLIEVGHRQRVTSIADFLGARYGKRQSVAAGVAVICLAAVLPYLALQFRALQQIWSVVNTGAIALPDAGADNVTLLVAIGLAAFAILFGVRRLDGSERYRGLMHAMAAESLVKLVAFLVVASLAAAWLMRAEIADVAIPPITSMRLDADFWAQLLISGIAILCLPRQFHVTVVEVDNIEQTRKVRWLFPLYLLFFMVLVVPIAVAGQHLFSGQRDVAADTYVQLIPMVLESGWGSALAFLGGISAATGMVLVATVSVSIMVTNELVMPVLFRATDPASRALLNFGNLLRRSRQATVFAISVAAWLVASRLSALPGLTQIGFLSFLGTAQLAPALLLGLYWRRAHGTAILCGMLTGAAVWLVMGVLPATLPAEGFWRETLLQQSFTGWINDASFALITFFSLGLNAFICVVLSLFLRPLPADRRQARAFFGEEDKPMPLDFSVGGVHVLQLAALIRPLLSDLGFQRFWRELETSYEQRLLPSDRAPRFVIAAVEAVLANAVGATSAGQIIGRLETDLQLDINDLTALMGDAQRSGSFNREILEAAVENLSHGVSVVDAELRLVAWNSEYQRMFDYPPRFLFIGSPIERVYRFNAERGMLSLSSERSFEQEISRRLDFLRGGSAYKLERVMPDGRVLTIQGAPLPDGGFVTTYVDISDYRELVVQLEEARTELESKLVTGEQALSERNAELRGEIRLRSEAETQLRDAFRSKAHFMSATSHDLLQPINAARLLAGTLAIANEGRNLLIRDQLINSLDRAQAMIEELREMARLDSGRMVAQRGVFPLQRLLDQLESQFAQQAEEKNITLRLVATSSWVDCDEAMLLRLMQNLVGNAIKYTDSGKVLVGVRRKEDSVRLVVADTGPGIDIADQGRIFNEFERLERTDGPGSDGLGLGLSLVARYAELLEAPLDLQSIIGRGTQFSLLLPSKASLSEPSDNRAEVAQKAVLLSGVVLCIDNDPSLRAGIASVLESFGLHVESAASGEEARWLLAHIKGQLLAVIADYHLDKGENGITVASDILATGLSAPVIIISADDSGNVRDASKAKGYRFLPKPIDPRRLRVLLEALAQEDSAAGGVS